MTNLKTSSYIDLISLSCIAAHCYLINWNSPALLVLEVQDNIIFGIFTALTDISMDQYKHHKVTSYKHSSLLLEKKRYNKAVYVIVVFFYRIHMS